MGDTSRRVWIKRHLIDIILVLLVVSYLVLRLSGGGLAVVSGRSMEPTLHTGDVVIYVKKDPAELKEGDVVIFVSNRGLVIHRVVEKYEVGSRICFIIQGDNNPVPDIGDPQLCPPLASVPGYERSPGIPEEWIVGKVVDVNGYVIKIPYIGIVALAIHNIFR
ncbi:MAG: signal peptidase I [Acidilobaceae archaeon]